MKIQSSVIPAILSLRYPAPSQQPLPCFLLSPLEQGQTQMILTINPPQGGINTAVWIFSGRFTTSRGNVGIRRSNRSSLASMIAFSSKQSPYNGDIIKGNSFQNRNLTLASITTLLTNVLDRIAMCAPELRGKLDSNYHHRRIQPNYFPIWSGRRQ